MPPEGAGWIALTAVVEADAQSPLSARMGGEGIYVFKTADGLRGVKRHCPHEGALLAKATLLGGGRMLKCPLHNFVFRLSDGVAVNCPGYRLGIFEIREDQGQLLARPVT